MCQGGSAPSSPSPSSSLLFALPPPAPSFLSLLLPPPSALPLRPRPAPQRAPPSRSSPPPRPPPPPAPRAPLRESAAEPLGRVGAGPARGLGPGLGQRVLAAAPRCALARGRGPPAAAAAPVSTHRACGAPPPPKFLLPRALCAAGGAGGTLRGAGGSGSCGPASWTCPDGEARPGDPASLRVQGGRGAQTPPAPRMSRSAGRPRLKLGDPVPSWWEGGEGRGPRKQRPRSWRGWETRQGREALGQELGAMAAPPSSPQIS